MDECCSVGITLIYEPTSMDSVPWDVRGLLHADYLLAKAQYPPKFSEVAGVKAWLEKIAAEKPVAPGDE